jgi:hypothetical protein
VERSLRPYSHRGHLARLAHAPAVRVDTAIVTGIYRVSNAPLRTLDCFATLAGQDVAIWTDHVEDVDVLAARLLNTQALVARRSPTCSG